MKKIAIMYFLSIAILVLTIAAGAIPSLVTMRDKNSKKLTKGAYSLFFILLLIVIATSAQIFLIDLKQTKDANENKDQNDSLQVRIKRGIDSGINSNNEFLAKAFKAEGVDITELKSKIQFLVDDTTNKSTIINNNSTEHTPDLNFSPSGDCIKLIEHSGDRYKFEYYTTSLNAVSNNIKITEDIGYINEFGRYIAIVHEGTNGVLNYSALDKLGISVIRTSVVEFDSPEKIQRLYITIKGTYTNLDGGKKFSLHSSKVFDFDKKIVSMAYGREWDSIRRNIYKEKN